MGRLLNKIKEPNDIKRISPKLYPILAQEIRDFLIDHVSQTGGQGCRFALPPLVGNP